MGLAALAAFPVGVSAQLRCLSPSDREIRSVTFEGNRQFSKYELKLRVLAEPTDLVRKIFRKGLGTKRCLRGDLLASDSIRLLTFYHDQGFSRARVRDTAINIGSDKVDIVFRIQEGEPVIIDSVSVIPPDFLAPKLGADLPRILKLQHGSRYSPAFAQADIDTIETRTRNSGYKEGRACVFRSADTLHIESSCKLPLAAGTHVSLRTELAPGSVWHISKVIISDTAITGRSAVIADKAVRQLLPFKEGDVYQERLLTQAQRQLYQLGTFYHASVNDTLPNGADSSVAIKVLVVEEYMRQISWLKQLGTQDCLLTGLQYSDNAFNHSINRFEASAQVSKLGWAPPPGWEPFRSICHATLAGDEIASTKVNYSATVRYSQPAALGGLLNRSISAYREVRGSYKAYLRTTQIGFNTSLSKLFAERVSPDLGYKQSLIGLFGYNLEYGHTDAPPPVFCFLFRACDDSSRAKLSQDKVLSVFNGLATRDWRNDPLKPTSGTLARVEGRVSPPKLSSSDLQFEKGVGDLTWYHRALRNDVLVLRYRRGLIAGGSSNPTGGVAFIPPQERLYTGGETSVRGFGTNELGPLIYVVSDTTHSTPTLILDSLKIVQRIPTGGNAMSVWNFEYRVQGPIFTNRLQTILFLDGGKLWTPGPDVASVPHKWTPGVAFRMFLRIGPRQINVAYNNHPDPPGALYYDQGISSKDLVCLSNPVGVTSRDCAPTFAPPQRAATWKNPFSRLRFSIAFPPDY